MRGATIEVKCKNCKTPFMARVADRKRGWGKYCSKSCKAQKCVNGRRAYANYANLHAEYGHGGECFPSMESGIDGHGQE